MVTICPDRAAQVRGIGQQSGIGGRGRTGIQAGRLRRPVHKIAMLPGMADRDNGQQPPANPAVDRVWMHVDLLGILPGRYEHRQTPFPPVPLPIPAVDAARDGQAKDRTTIIRAASTVKPGGQAGRMAGEGQATPSPPVPPSRPSMGMQNAAPEGHSKPFAPPG